MAFLFSKVISGHGEEPLIYCLNKNVASACEAKVTENFDLLHTASLVILGGGGFLTDSSLFRRIIHTPTRHSTKRLKGLYKSLLKSNKKIIPISIGGDGTSLSKFKSKFLKEVACRGTVRLESDLSTMVKINVENYFNFPDILWNLNRYCSNTTVKNFPKKIKKIGINIKNKDLSNKNLKAFKVLEKKYELIFILSHIDIKKYNYEVSLENYSTLKYSGDIDRFVSGLADLDLVLSSKLHIGMSALSVSTPFLSYRGPQKAVFALKESGLSSLVANGEQTLECVISDFVDKYDSKFIDEIAGSIAKMKNNAQKHIDFLSKEIELAVQ